MLKMPRYIYQCQHLLGSNCVFIPLTPPSMFLCLASCRWKGMPCSHNDFQTTLTDAGLCYTFNGHMNANSTMNATGKCHVDLLHLHHSLG